MLSHHPASLVSILFDICTNNYEQWLKANMAMVSTILCSTTSRYWVICKAQCDRLLWAAKDFTPPTMFNLHDPRTPSYISCQVRRSGDILLQTNTGLQVTDFGMSRVTSIKQSIFSWTCTAFVPTNIQKNTILHRKRLIFFPLVYCRSKL